MKKVFYGLMILAVLVGGGFALFEDRIFTDIPEDVISNLEMRYNGKFQFVGYIEEENTENSRAMKIKGKYGEFKLIRYYDGKGVIHYNDNYLGYRYKKQIDEDLDTCFSRVDSRYKFEVDLDKSTFPDETDESVFYTNLISNKVTSLKVKAVTTPKWSDGDIATFSTKMKELKLKGNISMLRCGEKLISLSDFDPVMRSPESVSNKVFFSIGSNGNIHYINRE